MKGGSSRRGGTEANLGIYRFLLLPQLWFCLQPSEQYHISTPISQLEENQSWSRKYLWGCSHRKCSWLCTTHVWYDTLTARWKLLKITVGESYWAKSDMDYFKAEFACDDREHSQEAEIQLKMPHQLSLPPWSLTFWEILSFTFWCREHQYCSHH